MHMTHKETFPTTLKDLQRELHQHAQCGRNDVEFRLWIFIDQLGSLARHYTHDQKVNPTARPHGTKASRLDDAGHAIIQLLTTLDLMGIDLQDAVDSALVNLREKDFQRREESTTGVIKGTTVSFPSAETTYTGMAWVIQEGEKLTMPPPSHLGGYCILVMSHPTPDGRMKKFHGIVTDQGSSGCHAAIIARENKIPCIAGTGNATKRIKTGDMITMDLVTGCIIQKDR